MSSSPTGQRPGGLTALGVLNIIFGALGGIGVLITFAAINNYERLLNTPEGKDLPAKEVFFVLLLLNLVSATLLFVSGIGILGQKRFMGKILANCYGLL